jgi:hypothetical protein
MARSFAEVLKDQPSATAVHVDTTGQRRRARTYSQVIAEATRGSNGAESRPKALATRKRNGSRSL